MDVRSVVLFGAGASHGCSGVVPYAPPLGAGLYADLARHYPLWKDVPANLQKEFTTDFEQGMLSLVNQYSHAVGPLMRMMTEYFAIFRLERSARDLYSQLLTGLGGDLRHILFSSLNYECLFEIAAMMRSAQIAYFGDASIPANVARFWKLHGSCNFRAPGIKVAPEGASYAATGASFSPHALEAVSQDEAIAAVRGDGLYSAMCLYTVNKPIQIGTQVIDEMQQTWADSVRSAEKVIVIGTRPHDEDRHLWEPMAETDADLYFVGNKDGFDEWVARSGRAAAKSHFVAARFEAAITDIQACLGRRRRRPARTVARMSLVSTHNTMRLH